VPDLTNSWWTNPINPDSMRLNRAGFIWFHDVARQISHDVELQHALTAKHFLQLERLITEPYYIKKCSLVLFGERDAIMLQLHAGNLTAYLNSLESA